MNPNVLGYRKDGRPILPIKGGSETAVELPVEQAPAATTTPAAPTSRTFTEEEVAKIRQQEKDKLYTKLSTVENELTELRKDREERQQREQAEAEEKARIAREKQEAEADAKTLIKQKEEEWKQRFEQIEKERGEERAILEKERQFAALQAYIQKRVSEEQENIAPQFLDFINANTTDEVESFIEKAKEKTTELLQQVAEAQAAAAPPQRRGVSVTGNAPVGPMDTESFTQQISPEELQNMNMSDYAKIRGKLGIGGGSTQNRGMFG